MRWRISGVGWRLADSLVTLAHQLDDLWPTGGPTDGTIGDAAHSARRSDHNPNDNRVVTALDVDEVVEDRGAALVAALVAARDPRVKYIIHEGQIIRSYARSGTIPWEPSPYTGSNPHSGHVHISVSGLVVRYDDPSPWNLTGLVAGEDPMASISVEEWQSILNTAGVKDLNGDALVEDGVYGQKTRSALVKMARGGTSTGGPHSHPDLADKTHGHTATTTIR
jgi:hypothetical protein